MAIFIKCLSIYILLRSFETVVAKHEQCQEASLFTNNGDLHHDVDVAVDYNAWCSNSSETSITCHHDSSSTGDVLLQFDAGVKYLSFYIIIKPRLGMFIIVPPVDLSIIARLLLLKNLTIHVIHTQDVWHKNTELVLQEDPFSYLQYLRGVHQTLLHINDKLVKSAESLPSLEMFYFDQTQFLAFAEVQKAFQGDLSQLQNGIPLANFQTNYLPDQGHFTVYAKLYTSACDSVMYSEANYNYSDAIYSELTFKLPNHNVIDVYYKNLISHYTGNTSLELSIRLNLEILKMSKEEYIAVGLEKFIDVSFNKRNYEIKCMDLTPLSGGLIITNQTHKNLNYDNLKTLHKVFTNQLDLHQQCFPSNITHILVISLPTAFVLFIFLAYLSYRFRWRIQMRLYKLVSRFTVTNRMTVQQDDQQFVYDAFISYCAEDRFWVHNCLMKKLESAEHGFKLCIHYRDFPVGEDISSTILKSIYSSKRLIIVLSEIALGKPWCQFELQVALSQAVKRDIKLAVIKLGSFRDRVKDDTVAWILDNHVFLEWSLHKDAQKLFWAKLLDYMRGEGSARFCCLCWAATTDHKSVQTFAAGSNESQPLLQ